MTGNAEITGNTVSNGSCGGVSVESGCIGSTDIAGSFEMSGGKVSGNYVETGNCGGVSVSGTNTEFKMSGGEISGNSAPSIGGVYVASDAVFTMSGGKVINNTAISVSGIGGVNVIDSTFTMSGGEISGNTAANGYGGGVYSLTTISETGIRGGFNISGNASVTGNVIGGTITSGVLSGGTVNNVYLQYSSGMLTVKGALTGSVGVTAVGGKRVFAQADAGYNGGKLAVSDIRRITSDNASYDTGLDSSGKGYFGDPLPELTIDDIVYDGQDHAAGIVVKAGTETFSSDNYTVTFSQGGTDVTSLKNAESYTATIIGKGTYGGVTDVTFGITPKPTTIAEADGTKVYGEADPGLTARVTGAVGTETLNYTLSREAGENVGDHTISVTLGSNPNYTVSTTAGKLEIKHRSATVKADDKTKTEGKADPELTATVSGLVGSDTLAYTISRAAGEAEGNYTITAAGEAIQGNYKVTFNPGTLTVTKRTDSDDDNDSDDSDDDNGSDDSAGSYDDGSAGDNSVSGASGVSAGASGGDPRNAITPPTPSTGAVSAAAADTGAADTSSAAVDNTRNTDAITFKVSSKAHWAAVYDHISNSSTGSAFTIKVLSNLNVPNSLIKMISDKKATVVFDMGNNVKWTLNGKDVTHAKSVRLGVDVGVTEIPDSVIKDTAGGKVNVTLKLRDNGDFGFKSTLTIYVGKQYFGQYANLYYYNPKTKKTEFMQSVLVNLDGTVDLPFTHASDYVLVFDDKPADAVIFAAVDGSSVKLAWDKVDGAESYNVYVAKDGKWSKIKTTGNTTATVYKCSNNKTYKFLVRAKVNGKLTSVADSYQLKVKVCYKPVLKASVKDSKLTLKWSEVNNAEKYAVYKYTNGAWKLVKETDKLKYTVSVKPGKTCKYAVCAYVGSDWTKIGETSTATVKA